MADALKIDSNSTGLRYALEESIGVLPADPVWKPLEPNEYDDFGGSITTVARNPINDSRSRKKGVVVDLDASGGFTTDVTADNTTELMEGFMFAAARRKAELSVADAAAATDDFKPASGGDEYFANNLLFSKGFTKAANNGLHLVSGTPTGTSVVVTSALEDENGATNGIISRVGHQYGTGVATIDTSGSLPKLTFSGIVAASGVLTATDQPENAETVTIGGLTYTFQNTLTNSARNVKIGANLAATLLNLRNAINRNGVGTPGVDFAALTAAHPQVTATATGTTVTVTAIVAGTTGNSIATTDSYGDASWGAATLASGAGRSAKEFGVVVGEFICIGDDNATYRFDTVANNGLKRVRQIDNDGFILDKSTLPMSADAGTGKTVRVFFGRVIKNEKAELIRRQSIQFERSLGAPDDAQPDQIQAEYLTGAIANECTIEVTQADKVTAQLSYMARDHETRSAAVGRKAGARPDLVDSDAFNSTSHVRRASIAIVTPGSEAPADLFAYVMDLSITINNNVSANKAIKVLGAFDNTAGTFEVDAEMQAYFARVEAIQTVRDNADVTLDLTFAQDKKGWTLDMPLVSVGDALADVTQDEAIMLPITTAAAAGSKVAAGLDHTLLMVYWDYIPDVAV